MPTFHVENVRRLPDRHGRRDFGYYTDSTHSRRRHRTALAAALDRRRELMHRGVWSRVVGGPGGMIEYDEDDLT